MSVCYWKLFTTPSMAMYRTLRGRTILNRRSMYSKMATIISSSFLGAGLQTAEFRVFCATNLSFNCKKIGFSTNNVPLVFFSSYKWLIVMVIGQINQYRTYIHTSSVQFKNATTNSFHHQLFCNYEIKVMSSVCLLSATNTAKKPKTLNSQWYDKCKSIKII